MSFYYPLDHTRNEVRMLTIVDLPRGDTSGLVHCTLENVSLDDLTDAFAQSLSKSNQLFNETDTRSWFEANLQNTNNSKPKAVDIQLPAWRWKIDNGDRTTILGEWNETMEAIGADPSRIPKIPGPTYLMADSRDLEEATVQQDVYLTPRFQWGDFEAISYCWESDVREKQIIINSTVFEVPKNLEALLQRLQRLPDAKSGMKFWVDALCINQSDLKEKNHQVQLMQSIYTKAFAVIVWLGEGTKESNQAIDCISSLNHFIISEEGEEGHELKDIQHLLDDIAELPWDALVSFLSRNYWKRLWIIQELALNHNMSLFLCGELQLSRSMILRTSEFYQRHSVLIDGIVSRDSQSTLVSGTYGSIWPIVYQVHCLITTKGKGNEPARQPIQLSGYPHHIHKLSQSERPSLGVVLDLCRKATVTDPRDKIYGILGLLPHNIATSISPDYTLSHEQVFYQFARTLLQEESRLETILSWCRFGENSVMSSWIPDWTTPFSRNHIQWLRRRSAAGFSTAQCSISEDTRYLNCRGFLFDSIYSVSGSLSENLPYCTETPKRSNQIHQLTNNNLQKLYDDEKSLHATLWRTLRQDHPFRRDIRKTCLDIAWIDWDVLESDPRRYDYLRCETITSNVSWETFESFRQTNADFDVCGIKFKDFFPGMDHWSSFWMKDESKDTEHAELAGQMASDMHLIVLALTGRRLATTAAGYLGMVPEEAMKDDVIAVLYGCNFPVVLRPCGDRYLFIGEGYVDGVMDGELMEAQARGEYQERDITLC
ncbi:HET-domain-containing protein [Stipitochalara longipes BDJ]|nr:HET-domain-containing protein [Stipitochalara longipes BDJ]